MSSEYPGERPIVTRPHHYSLLATYCLLLTTYFSLLTTHYLPSTAYYSLPTSYRLPDERPIAVRPIGAGQIEILHAVQHDSTVEERLQHGEGPY